MKVARSTSGDDVHDEMVVLEITAVDPAHMEAAEQALDKELAERDAHVVFEFTHQGHVDSEALGYLMLFLKKARARERGVALVHPPSTLVKFLDQFGLMEMFTVADSVDDARERLT